MLSSGQRQHSRARITTTTKAEYAEKTKLLDKQNVRFVRSISSIHLFDVMINTSRDEREIRADELRSKYGLRFILHATFIG